MTEIEELKILARRHEWAFEELAFDQKTVEWNKLCGGGLNALYGYLKSVFGSRTEVLKALNALVDRYPGPAKTLSVRKR